MFAKHYILFFTVTLFTFFSSFPIKANEHFEGEKNMTEALPQVNS